MNTYNDSRARFIARLFLCQKQHTVARNDNDATFLVGMTIRVLLRFFAFRLCRCSTVKSGSKREKLLLKTFILPRVELYFEFGSFLFTQQFCPWSLTSVFATLTRTLHRLFPVLPRLCRKANKKTEVNPNEKSSLFHKKSQR